jgi:N-acetylglutamate synthase-like GNAT family acetyltransferase
MRISAGQRAMTTAQAAALIGEYRQDRRQQELPNFVREDLGSVVRYSPTRSDADGIVCFTDIADGELHEQIRRHVAHFEQLGVGFEWKVYGSDQPADLAARLVDAGFEQGDPEALMMFEVSRFRASGRTPAVGVQFSRLTNVAMLEPLTRFQETIWQRSFPWLPEHMRKLWNTTSFYVAHYEDELIGLGYIEYPHGSRFAEMHGGSVLPAFRGRGIYSALFELRMLDARERGVSCVAVDAAPMSRPILEAKGFEWMDATYPMTWVRR